MHEGTIITLHLDHNYGFIFKKAAEPDVYFHASALTGDLMFDEKLKERRVRFDIIERDGRLRAANVRAAR
jgi:cold shock CspA family protein